MPGWLVSGFSLAGLAAVVAQQIPGIVWAIHPPKVDPFAQNSGALLVEILEKGFGIATILMIVVVPARAAILPGLSTLFLVGAFVVLAAYYVLYVLYYCGFTELPVLLGMAAFPPVCYLLIALDQGNYPALVTSVVFGIVHVSLTYVNLGPGSGQGRAETRTSSDTSA